MLHDWGLRLAPESSLQLSLFHFKALNNRGPSAFRIKWKIEGWEILKVLASFCSSESPNVPTRPLVLHPVFQALWVSQFSWLALGFVKQEEAVSACRGRSASWSWGHRTHFPCTWKTHSSSVQKSNMPDLYTNNGDMTVTAHMLTSLAWEIIQKSANKPFKRRAEEDSCAACHVCLSSKSSAQIYLEQMFWGLKKADLANSLLLCIISDSSFYNSITLEC